MRNYVKYVTALAVLLLLLIDFDCTSTVIAGSETTNGMTVTVAGGFLSGKTVSGTMVMCFSSNFNPDSNTGFADTVFSDSNGVFNFGKLMPMTYNVFTYAHNGDSCAILQELIVTQEKSTDTIVTFTQTTDVKGRIVSNNLPVSKVKVYTIGAPFKTTSDSTGEFRFTSVPGGYFVVNAVDIQRHANFVRSGSAIIAPHTNWDSILTIEIE